MGEIYRFNFQTLDEFLEYLGKLLFAPTNPYSPLSSKYPINLISLSAFFKHWNSIIGICRNSKNVYNEAKKDIEKYYVEVEKNQMEHSQKMLRIRYDILMIIASSLISIFMTYVVTGQLS